jgi:alkylation response protein AidB-like acyl-CoA dehydrogenase
VRDGDGWRLDGHKRFVVDGHGADALIVAAQAADGVALLLVPAAAPGCTVERLSMVDAHNAARVTLDGVRVGDDALVGSVGQGRALLDGVLDVGRAVLASELVGLADEVFERTVAYLQQRRQFGQLIGGFQALQHRAAELFCDLELARALVRQAQAALDAGTPDAARTGGPGQGQGRAVGHPRGAGRRADARRHRHDRRAGHRPVHEARPRAAGMPGRRGLPPRPRRVDVRLLSPRTGQSLRTVQWLAKAGGHLVSDG